jgi:TM2 domain-containing membrane protein YozV
MAGRASLMTTANTTRILATVTITVVALAALDAAAEAGRSDLQLLRAEQLVLGTAASRTLDTGAGGGLRTFDQVGGDGLEKPDDAVDEIGGSSGEEPEKKAGGSSNTGRKFAAGGLSAILPGAGQFYNGEKKKAYIMAGIEVAIWVAWFVFDEQGDSRLQDAKDYASIYAGAGGTDETFYWRAVGRYAASDDYNEDLIRQGRASDDPLPSPVGPDLDWLWVNQTRQADYRRLYDDSDNAYNRRDFMILFMIVNRVVSVVDAVVGAGKTPGKLEAEALGMDFELQMVPSWQDPGARCVISRSF